MMLRRWARRCRLFTRALRSRRIRSLLGPRAIGVLYAAENGRILVTPEDGSTLVRRLGRRGGYGESSLELICRYTTPRSRVLFVGAHVGTLLIPVARRVRHVCGIEANPHTFQLLRLNLLLNEVRNADIHHFAAGDAEREIEFLVNTSNSGGSKMRPLKRDFAFTYDRPETVTVPMRSVDRALAGEVYDVIVMDIEGAETLALRGMQEKLAACRVLHLEYDAEHLDKVAGVELDAFLASFDRHFDTAFVLGSEPGRSFRRAEFRAMLGPARPCDVLFLKDGVTAAGERPQDRDAAMPEGLAPAGPRGA